MRSQGTQGRVLYRWYVQDLKSLSFQKISSLRNNAWAAGAYNKHTSLSQVMQNYQLKQETQGPESTSR